MPKPSEIEARRLDDWLKRRPWLNNDFLATAANVSDDTVGRIRRGDPGYTMRMLDAVHEAMDMLSRYERDPFGRTTVRRIARTSRD